MGHRPGIGRTLQTAGKAPFTKYLLTHTDHTTEQIAVLAEVSPELVKKVHEQLAAGQ